jgi:hypothetical protein
MESLKNHLDNMYGNNQELIVGFQSNSSLLEADQDRISQQFEAYKNLELKVLEYIGMAKMHN